MTLEELKSLRREIIELGFKFSSINPNELSFENKKYKIIFDVSESKRITKIFIITYNGSLVESFLYPSINTVRNTVNLYKDDKIRFEIFYNKEYGHY
ncbi:MAG: hypothetical protein ABIP51_17870 [Bacteroidia bacterium]